MTFIAVGASWHLAAQAGASEAPPAAGGARVEPLARGHSPGADDGSSVASAVRPSPFGPLLVLTPGIPLTVVDQGRAMRLRAFRGATVGEVLELARVALGPHDEVAAPERAQVEAGDIITVHRVAVEETVVQEPIPYPIRTVADASLPAGRAVVATAGVAGVAENTYRVRTVDGAEASRELVASVEVQAPVAEVRRIGTRPPPGPSEIVAIIRAAAAAWGADPDQLLRVAYCESRYNPNAYNPSSGASGLFQFLPRTWAANSVRAGYGGASVFEPVANANTAAYMFASGQARQWSCK